MTLKRDVDYGEIGDDFAFFIRHSNESAAQVSALLPHLDALVARGSPPHMFDFGCGDGTFGSRLLEAFGVGSGRIALTLAEPVGEHLAQAREKLAPLVASVAVLDAALQDPGDRRFDLILANHSLYYVADPAGTVEALVALLAPGGSLIAPMLDRDNTLAKLWRDAFGAMGEPFPFVLAEEVEAVLEGPGCRVRRETVTYRIDFPDNAAARRSVLRFLMGDHLARLDESTALALFDGHARNGRVVMETAYPHLLFRAPDQV